MGPFGRSEGGEAERQISRSLVWRMRNGEVIRDTELQGFGIEAGDQGKIYFLESALGGERRRYIIGRHGEPWTPETARAEAWRLKAELLRGADAVRPGGGPAAHKRRRRLTGSIVDSLKPGEIAWDGEVTGFGARCQRVDKVYFLKARAGGRQRWITIGAHGPEWSPESARREAQRLLAEIAAGNGPAAEEPPRRNITVAQLCNRYLEAGCAGKSASTIATDRGRIERHIKPLLGNRRIASVTAADIDRFVASVSAGETATDLRTGLRGRAIVTGGAGTAARTLGLLGAVFSFAVNRNLLDRNPVRAARRAMPRRAPRVPAAEELSRLATALAEAEREGADPSALAALRLIAATGCRAQELLALTWTDVDLERGCLKVPNGRAGQRYLALCSPALGLLRSLPRGDAGGPVLPGQTAAGRLPALLPLWRAVRARAGLRELRLQELSTVLPALGAEVLERFLLATPPPARAQAPGAQSAEGEAAPKPLPRVPLGAVPTPSFTPTAPGAAVSLGPQAATPSAALLAWRAKADVGIGRRRAATEAPD